MIHFKKNKPLNSKVAPSLRPVSPDQFEVALSAGNVGGKLIWSATPT